MIVVEQLANGADLSGVEIDVAPMTWERRQKARQRVKTTGGRELGLALPTGTILSPGDVLMRANNIAVVVEGVAEDVFVIRPDGWEASCLACHQLGNLHRPIALDGRDILALFEPSLEAQLKRFGLPYTIESRVFDPAKTTASAHVH